jgi:hypothetical protein
MIVAGVFLVFPNLNLMCNPKLSFPTLLARVKATLLGSKLRLRTHPSTLDPQATGTKLLVKRSVKTALRNRFIIPFNRTTKHQLGSQLELKRQIITSPSEAHRRGNKMCVRQSLRITNARKSVKNNCNSLIRPRMKE